MRKLFHEARETARDMYHDHKAIINQQPLPAQQAQPQHRSHRQQIMASSAYSAASPQTTVPPVTEQDVLRYRYHHGVNLGSVFVLEKWLSPSMFPPTATAVQSSELEAARLWTQQETLEGARRRFETHWTNAVTEKDFGWLASVGATTIRLPIGYFTLGPNFCASTPFASYSPIYTNAWGAVKSLISRARAYGIGVLVDFHALPGGANGGDHSGTNSGKAELWGNKANLALAQKCLEFLANEIATAPDLTGVVGLQVVNESDTGAPGLYDFYNNILASLATIIPTLPIYISDAWSLPPALSYIAQKNSPASSCNPIVVDTHLYWAFSDADKAKSPQQVIAEVPSKLSELDSLSGSVHDKGAVQAVVGEYSCVLSEDSWSKGNPADRPALVQQFGQAQSARYQAKSGGAFFWTWKMDWMTGGEWGFVAQSSPSAPAIAPPSNLLLPAADVTARLNQADAQHDTLLRAAVGQHAAYWDQAAPGQRFEHWRFEAGWKVGWADAAAFYGFRVRRGLGATAQGADAIGMLELWTLKRMRECGADGGWACGGYAWEFEQGMRRGLGDFGGVVGLG